MTVFREKREANTYLVKNSKNVLLQMNCLLLEKQNQQRKLHCFEISFLSLTFTLDGMSSFVIHSEKDYFYLLKIVLTPR